MKGKNPVIIIFTLGFLIFYVAPLFAQESVSFRSGRLSYSVNDRAVQAGAADLGVSRTLAQERMGKSGLFGTGWSSNWEKRLTRIDQIVFIQEDAGIVTFTGETSKNEFAGLSGEKINVEKDGQAIRYFQDGTSEKYDADGRLVEIDLRNGNKVKLLYDNEGRLKQVKGPRGRFLEFTTDNKGKATRIESSLGTTVLYGYQGENLIEVRINDAPAARYAYDEGGRLTLIEQPQTGAIRIGYDNKGRVISREWADGAKERYDYDDGTNTVRRTDAGGGMTVIRWSKDYRQEEITDPAGNRTAIWYSENGKPVRITGPSGGTSESAYDALGRTTSVKDPAGRVTSFEYLGDSALVKSVTLAGGTKIDYHYDGQSNLTSMTSDKKTIISYSYTPDGLVESVGGFQVPQIRFSYYTDGKLKSLGNALGDETRYEYDKRGNPVREISPDGGITMRAYDSMNRITGETDPSGGTAVFGYDPQGRIGSITYPDKKTKTYGYDRRGRLVSLTDRAGRTARYEYDNADRLVKVTHLDNTTEQYRYDLAGNRIEATGTNGLTRQYQYDGLGRIIREIAPGGTEISYVYDVAGNLAEVKDKAGSRTVYRYNASGQVTGVTDSLGATVQYGYDTLGSLLQVADPLGKIKQFSYTPDGTLESVREATGDEGGYSYDRAGRLATIKSPGGGTTELRYDAMGNLISRKGPLGNEHRYSYDPAGRLTKETNASGQTIGFTYDASGMLAGKALSDGRKITYRYGPGGALAEATDGKFPIAYQYDKDGKITGVEYSAIGKKTASEYDKTGLRLRLVLPDGKDVRYEHDSLRRISAIVLPDGKKVQFIYDAKGRQERVLYPNGITGYQEYDASGQVLRTSYKDRDGKAIFEEGYRYDLAGNLVERKNAGGESISYLYDAAGQLTEEAGPDGAMRYAYAKGGNRKELQKGKDTIRYTYDLADRMVKAGDTDISYDAAGNLISKGAGRFAYDSENMLVSATGPSDTKVSYGYSPSGDRIWRKDGKGLTYFIYDGLNLIQEIGEDLSVRVTYVYAPGIDRPVAMSRDGKVYYYLADRLGSVRHLTDEQGIIVATYDYDAFGKIRKQEGPVQNPFTFTGREFDPETGLYYYRARYYDPQLGRFLSHDPEFLKSLEPIDLNPYLYVKNNPVRYKDPLGLDYSSPGIMQSWSSADLWLYLNDASSHFREAAYSVLRGRGEGTPALDRNYYAAPNAGGPGKYGWKAGSPPAQEGLPLPGERGSVIPPKGPPTLAVPKSPDAAGIEGGKGVGTRVSPVVPREGLLSRIKSGAIKGAKPGLGVSSIFSGIDYYSCIKENRSHTDCLTEFGSGLVIGMGVGAAVGATAAAAALSAPAAALLGGGALVVGAVSTGSRFVFAQTSDAAQQTTLPVDRVQNILDNLRAKKPELSAMGNAFCEAQAKVRDSANKAKEAADQAKTDIETALGKMSTDMKEGVTKDCNSAQQKIIDLPDKIAKCRELIKNSEKSFDDTKGSLSRCISQKDIEDAELSLRTAKAFTSSVNIRCGEAQADITSLQQAVPKLKEAVKGMGSKMSGAENSYAANLAAVEGYASTAKSAAADAKEKLAKFNAQKDKDLRTATNLSGVMPASSAGELAAIRGSIDAVSLPCADNLEEYEGTAKGARDSIKVAWPKDLSGAAALLSNAPQIAQKLAIDSTLSTCGSLKPPTGNEFKDADQALTKLQEKTPEWLKNIEDLKALCINKLQGKKKPPTEAPKPPEEDTTTTKKPPEKPGEIPAEPQTKPHVLSRFGVFCSPKQITVGGAPSVCQASGVYADDPSETPVVLPGATFNRGPSVTATAADAEKGAITVTATYEGASDSAIIIVVKGKGDLPKDKNLTSPATGGSTPTLPPGEGSTGTGTGDGPAGSGSIGPFGNQPTDTGTTPTGTGGTGGQQPAGQALCPGKETPVIDRYGNVSCPGSKGVIPPPAPETEPMGPDKKAKCQIPPCHISPETGKCHCPDDKKSGQSGGPQECTGGRILNPQTNKCECPAGKKWDKKMGCW